MRDEIGFLVFTIGLAVLVVWHHVWGLPSGFRDLLGDEDEEDEGD